MQTPETKKPKIAVLHDSFLYRGGGERLVTLMAKSLGADLISGFFSEGSFDPRELGFEGAMIALGKPVFAKGIRHLTLIQRFQKKAKVLREYDIVILSGNCLDALRHVREDAKVYYYCHTPPRYLYDFRDRYLEQQHRYIRPIFRFAFSFFARIYERHLGRFDALFTNSKNVQERLKTFTGKSSEIIYPPIDTTFFRPKSDIAGSDLPFPPAQYFYSWARLSPPKRVDLIIETFLQMPDKNLIFSYGKNDPMKAELLAKIQNAPNIRAIESPNDNLLLDLICAATATIYIPLDEDFGMSPVESMACGVPVIGVDEGGLLETVIDGKTGKLIKIMNYESGIMNLKQVIQNTPRSEWENMNDACIERSRDFSLEKFQEKLRYYLSS